jgi:hypothetical protein
VVSCTDERTVLENYGCLDLAVRDRPITAEERGAALWLEQREAVALIEPNRPVGSSPCPDKDAASTQRSYMAQ